MIADLAHAQGALVGYVHPFDTAIDPAKEKSLTHLLPADVAHGKVDYIEIVCFSDHNATADVWYRLLNLVSISRLAPAPMRWPITPRSAGRWG